MLSIRLFIIVMISLCLSNAKSVKTSVSKKISTDGRCGKEFGHCREGYCCSKIGWCGNSDLHCKIEEGCQSEFGQCHKPKNGNDKVNSESSDEEDINEKRCGEGYGSCKKGYCCSKYGWCGKSDAYCNQKFGCQSEYGMCVSKKAAEKPIENNNEFSEDELPISEDGRCGKGVAICEEGFCCSKYGWCGKTDLYCIIEKGCQAEYGKCFSKKDKPTKDNGEVSDGELSISKDGRCGKGVAICGDGNCCSSFGWCGKTKDYCKIEKGCQAEFGKCYSKKPVNTTKINGKNDSNKEKEDKNKSNDDEKLPVSTSGKCGEGLAKCPEGFCCSKYGWCGKTDLYCKLEEGCQAEFGTCNSVATSGKKDVPTEDDNESSDEELPLSKDGRCGKGIAVCGKDSCCSSFGWCGKTDDHCEIEKGCQTEYGKCLPSKPINDSIFDMDKIQEIYGEFTEDEDESTDEPSDDEIFEEETSEPLEIDYYFFN